MAQKSQVGRSTYPSSSQMTPQILSFGGAKGGSGRTLLCASTALSLARLNHRVLAIDLDLGAANLHTHLGVLQPKVNLERWLLGQEERLEAICTQTDVPNLILISSAASIFTLTDLDPERLVQLVREARQLEVDYILIDLGAGLSPHHLDLFNLSGRGFIVTTPEPAAIQNTFSFFKATLIRRIEVMLKGRPWLKKILSRAAFTQANGKIASISEMLGMLRELDVEVNREVKAQLQSLNAHLVINRAYPEDEQQVVRTLTEICRRYLHFTLDHTLTLPEDQEVQNTLRQLRSLSSMTQSELLSTTVKWVNDWLTQQPYTGMREECLQMIGQPALLSSRGGGGGLTKPSLDWTATTTPEPTLIGISRLQDAQKAETVEFLSAIGSVQQNETGQSEMAGLASMTLKQLEEMTLNGALEQAQFFSRSAEGKLPSVLSDDSEAFESQSEGFIEPEPIRFVAMEDPPRHEVTALEEEVKTPEGWLHLKTSDLAPFRPVIQVSIYREGIREIFFEESYEGIYDLGEGTQIEKRVERVHHENAKLLSERGISGWWSAQG